MTPIDSLLEFLYEQADSYDRTGNAQKERGNQAQFYELANQRREWAAAVRALQAKQS